MDYKELEALAEPIRNQTDVAMKITEQLFKSEFKDTNMVYSPLSINIVLSLIAAGSIDNSQLVSFLNSKSIKHLNSLAFKLLTSVFSDLGNGGGPRLNFTNALWVDESSPPLDESYKKVAVDSYKAALNEVDIISDPEKVRIEVNKWVEEQTKGLIPQILPPGSVDNTTRQILANALYFKATWDDSYYFCVPPNSNDLKFHLLNGESFKGVSFMSSGCQHFVAIYDDFKVLRLDYRNCTYDDFKVLRLDYRNRKYEDFDKVTYKHDGRSFSMWWLLPNSLDGLPTLAARVCSESGFLDDHLNYERFMYVKLKKFLIPKFKISSGFEVSSVVKKLGLPDLMTIFHKSVIEVNENGTTAAAATCGVVTGSAGPPPKPKEIEEFVADHPFMFLLRENRTGTILFMGKVMNPLAG